MRHRTRQSAGVKEKKNTLLSVDDLPIRWCFLWTPPRVFKHEGPVSQEEVLPGGCLSQLSEHRLAQTGIRSGSDLCFVLYLTRDGKTTASQVLLESMGSENNLANPTDTISWLHRYLKSAKSSKPVALSPFRVNHMTLFGKEKLCIPQVLIFNTIKCFAIYTTHSGLVSDLF